MIRRQAEGKEAIEGRSQSAKTDSDPYPEKRTCEAKSNPLSKKWQCTGARMETDHGSYFSDPRAARPSVKAILQAIDLSRPAVVADWAEAQTSS